MPFRWATWKNHATFFKCFHILWINLIPVSVSFKTFSSPYNLFIKEPFFKTAGYAPSLMLPPYRDSCKILIWSGIKIYYWISCFLVTSGSMSIFHVQNILSNSTTASCIPRPKDLDMGCWCSLAYLIVWYFSFIQINQTTLELLYINFFKEINFLGFFQNLRIYPFYTG